MTIESPKVALIFPGQEEQVDSANPERSLLTNILKPYEALRRRVGDLKDTLFFGNSFGIFAALVAGGALTRDQALDLADVRGRIVRKTEAKMAALAHEASLRGEDVTYMGRTAMMRLIGLNNIVPTLVDEYKLRLSNDYGSVVVLTGFENAIDQALPLINSPKATKLDIIGSYHDPIRIPDSKTFSSYVEDAPVQKAEPGIISSTRSRLLTHPDDIREELVGMMWRPVVLTEVLQAFKDHGITVAFDLDQIESFKKLAGRIKEARDWLNLLKNPEERANFVKSHFGIDISLIFQPAHQTSI